MNQVTWRAPRELVERVQNLAAQQGRSMNEYLTRVLDAATSPDDVDSESERVRARLARAGLLANPPSSISGRPSSDSVERARAEAGTGAPLSDLVAGARG